ncbi:MAG: GIY-YIG nuclease family protein [bacterium]|nr:GIY-YIG nuclease family protein [bacterium]
MTYVYISRSVCRPNEKYVGVTGNLKRRLAEHNAGKSAYTARYKPWEVETYIAFSDTEKAIAFEKYLKSGSGRAFCVRHF